MCKRSIVYPGILIGWLLSSSCGPALTAAVTPSLAPSPSAPTRPAVTQTPAPTLAPSVTAEPTAPTSTPGDSPTPSATPRPALAVLSLQMLDTQTGWAMGQVAGDLNDHILRTVDGGVSWQDVTPPVAPTRPDSDADGRSSVAFFLDGQDAWVTYSIGPSYEGPLPDPVNVWRTRDGGQTWSTSQPIYLGEAVFYEPSDVVFADAQTGWFMAHIDGGMNHDYIEVFASRDGGQTWTAVVDPYKENLPMGCYKSGMIFTDQRTGWVSLDCNGVLAGGGSPGFFRTANGGRTWRATKLPPPAAMPDLFAAKSCEAKDLELTPSGVGVLTVGCNQHDPGGVAVSYVLKGSQQTWSGQLLPLPFGAADYVSASLGWFAGYADVNQAGATLYQTLDGGQTWKLIGPVGWAGQVDFVDERDGWAAAYAGGAHVLLKTTDGGRTWGELALRFAP